MSNPIEFRVYIATFVVMVISGVMGSLFKRPLPTVILWAIFIVSLILFCWLTYPYVKANNGVLWQSLVSDVKLYPLVTSTGFALLTGLAAYSFLTWRPSETALPLAKRTQETQQDIESIDQSLPLVGTESSAPPETESSSAVESRGDSGALVKADRSEIAESEKDSPLAKSWDTFASISPENPYPIGFENIQPGHHIDTFKLTYPDHPGGDLRFAFAWYEIVRPPEDTGIESIRCRYIRDLGSERVESVSFKFNRYFSEVHDFVRERLMEKFDPGELHTLGDSLYWRPAKGVSVLLKRSGYEIIARNGVIPLSLREFESIAPSKFTLLSELFDGERVCWQYNRGGEMSDFRKNVLKVEYEDSHPANKEMQNNPDILQTSTIVEFCGELKFQDDKVIVENAFICRLTNL